MDDHVVSADTENVLDVLSAAVRDVKVWNSAQAGASVN